MTDTSKEAIELSVSALRKIAEDQRCHARDEWDDSDCIDRAADRLAALRAELNEAKAEIERKDAALSKIESMNPTVTTLMDDGCWRSAHRELQCIARQALKGTSDD